jgi:hypothetical protein
LTGPPRRNLVYDTVTMFILAEIERQFEVQPFG